MWKQKKCIREILLQFPLWDVETISGMLHKLLNNSKLRSGVGGKQNQRAESEATQLLLLFVSQYWM
jgi:hypothetical protein